MATEVDEILSGRQPCHNIHTGCNDWVREASSSWVMQPERCANHSSIYLVPKPRMRVAIPPLMTWCLLKHRDSFTICVKEITQN
jgi:hypothetical protein